MKTPAPARSLTRLYVLSLGAIAVLSITGQALVQQQLRRQNTDLEIINTVQARQTLCERLLKTVMAVAMTREPNLRQERLNELRHVLDQWKRKKALLQQDFHAMVSPADLAELEVMLKKLDPSSKEILDTAQMILDRFDGRSTPAALPSLPDRSSMSEVGMSESAMSGSGMPRAETSGTVLDPEEIVMRPRLLKAEQDFTRLDDDILHWYNAKAKEGVARLKVLELSLLAVTLLVLVLEGMLIFRPAVRKLEETMAAVRQALKQVTQEQEKSEKLLLNILPEPIADRLKHEPQAIADGFAEVTVLFADIVGFTELSSRLSPRELVVQLNEIFSQFDRLAEKYGLEKIKTIGDAYMVVGGLPQPREDHAIAIAEMAIEMQEVLQAINQNRGEALQIRVGINSGPVVAGVIGLKKFIYDLWGDTVNVASRMESHGMPGNIHVSEATYQKLRDRFELEERGTISVKGKGEMKTYWLKSKAKMMSQLG